MSVSLSCRLFLFFCDQIPTISKSLDYNPDGMLFIICDAVQEVRDTLGR